ncbi:MAG: thioredoxin family protein, partial [Proteobacteria bacterium]|nr:thioredoxin family protein [Pseudomonadota bacterium]
GAASGARDPLAPLAGMTQPGAAERVSPELHWRRVHGLAELQTELAQAKRAGQPVALDFYADWCISCKVMERTVFSAPTVAAQLSRFRLLQADVTANDALDQALLKHFGLFGPPSMLFFAPNGDEIGGLRMQGEMNLATFDHHLGRVLSGV